MTRLGAWIATLGVALLSTGLAACQGADPPQRATERPPQSAAMTLDDGAATAAMAVVPRPAPNPEVHRWHASALPLLDGQEARLRQWVADMKRQPDAFAAHRERTHASDFYLYLQRDPSGSASLLMYQRASSRHLGALVASEDAFDRALVTALQDTTGVDLAARAATATGHPNELLWDMAYVDAPEEAEPYVMALPLLEGRTVTYRGVIRSLNTDLRDSVLRSREAKGMLQEQVWLQQSDEGNVALVVHRARDPGRALAEMHTSRDRFDRWFRDNIYPLHGMDASSGPPTRNELLMGWQAP